MKEFNNYLILTFILIGIIFVIGGLFAGRSFRIADTADYYDLRDESR